MINFVDKNVFFFLNHTISNAVLDVVMPFVTNLNNWRIPILIIWFFLVFKGGKKGRVAAVLIIPIIVMNDQVSSSLLKPWIARIRPCHELDNVKLLVSCGGKYSFPSSHATNIAGFAMLFSFIYRRFWGWFCGLVIIIGLSRSYVGVHYPGDVLFGFLLGSTISLIIFSTYKLISLKYPSIEFEST